MPAPDTPDKFYLTTPIYYVNARPHIGHAYSTIVADVLARRHRLLGHDTFFLTGTDEHGQKIERSAAAAGIPPQQFADQISKTFRDLWDRMGITYNQEAFIRTTDPRHKQGVQKLFRQLYEQGHIYLSTYTGQYSIGEEMFVEGPPGTIGPDGRPTETVTEENFFFRLSNFQRPLLDLIEGADPVLKITPESSRNEVLNFLRGDVRGAVNKVREDALWDSESLTLEEACKVALERGVVKYSSLDKPFPERLLYAVGALKDLSVSRSSFTWGIPVPEAVQRHAGTTQPHVIYVWLDALANYMTAIGYGSDCEADRERFEKYWPANLHLVGKEITRFHCVYWPAFLLALNPELAHKPDEPMPILTLDEHKEWAAQWLPKQVTANGWLLFDNAKMSKSKGNVVRTETILEAFGEHVYAKQFPESTKTERDLFAADVLRYYLLREIPFGQDGSFTFDSMITRYNADLANGYGNLVSRTLNLIQQNLSSETPKPPEGPWLCAPSGKAWLRDDRTAMAAEDAFLGTADIIDTMNQLLSIFLEVSKRNIFDLGGIMLRVSFLDRYISFHKPWLLAKSADIGDRTKLCEILYTSAESLRLITALLYPYIPTITPKVWQQLGLGDIELAAKNGELQNLQWGGLKPGTKLGPLSPIFPRADKSLAALMEDMEIAAAPTPKETPMPTPDTTQQPATPITHTADPLKDQGDKQDPTDPAAPPRTSTLETDNPGAHVAASSALTTEREGTPPHTEAPASGIFAATAGPSAPEASPHTPEIGIDDFVKIDLRVAKILVAERIPKADKLLRLEVDLGYEQRQILSGIAEHYTPEELIGRKIVIIANLAPRRMRGLESRGMLLAASEGENGKPILATFAEDIAVGTRLR